MSWEVSAGFSIVIAVPLFALYDLLRHIAPATHQGTEPLCSSADPPPAKVSTFEGSRSLAIAVNRVSEAIFRKDVERLLLGAIPLDRLQPEWSVNRSHESTNHCDFLSN